MKVAYLAIAPYIAGSERSLQILIEHVGLLGIDPIIVAPKNSPLHAWAEDREIRSFKIDVAYVSLKTSPMRWALIQLSLIKLILMEKVDLIHSNQMWSFPSTKYISKLLNIPVVCHLRDPLEPQSDWWLLPGPDATICVSKYIETELQACIGENFRKNNYTLIDAIEIPQRVGPNKELYKLAFTAKKKFSLPTDSLVMGFIGQISDVKGVYELIETFSLIDKGNLYLLVAGKDPSEDQKYIEKCELLVVERSLSDKVKFIGFVDDVRDFYHAVDLVVMYSKREPLGRIPLEAGANFTPTVASNVGGLPELIEHGHTGWLERETESAKRAENLERVISEDLFQFGLNARVLTEKIASPEKYATKITEIYRSLL